MKKKNYKLSKLLALLLGLTVVFSGCGDKDTNSSSTSTTQQDSSGNTAPVINEGLFTTSYEFAPEDKDSTWNADSATMITLNDSSAKISGSGASFSGKTLTIKLPGTYVLSGTLKNGQVLIDARKDDVVRIVLNGCSLNNDTGPAIYVPQSEKVVLILEKGTQNNISDGSNYALSGADDPDAAIYAQDHLSITGDGMLTVNGNYEHGVRAQDVFAVTGGVINITAKADTIRGRDGIAIQNGTFTLKAGSDGMQSNNDTDDSMGFIVISGGTFNIEAKNDGLQAQSSLTTTGGNFQIKTGDGSANAPVREEEFGRGGMRGGRGNAQQQTAQEETESMKALKAGKLIYAAGGDFTIDSEDDAIHSNDNLTVSAGKFNIKTGDDGFHADNATKITGGEINIPTCYEGIEGMNVTISGGNIFITAKDDAINAAGGVDNASNAGGPMGGDRYTANGDIFVRISGGTLDLYSPHDGIDANGNIYIEGGSIRISGPSQGMEGAIDLDGSMTVSGGDFVTAGSVLNASSSSTQPVILVSYGATEDSGTVIAIKDEKGNVLLEYTSKTSFYMSGFTSTSFEIGKTVFLFINGEKRMDIKLDSTVTSIGDDGGVYNSGRGDGRGNWGQNPPQGGRR